jgi:hypothetical protein
MKNLLKILIIILALSVNAEAQGYRDPNVAIYEAMRPMLEGQAYVPPQRIIIQHERVIPYYPNTVPAYNPEALRQAEQNLKEALDKVNKPVEYDFEK